MEEQKKIGVITLTALVAGNMIGSGIFLLPSSLARLGSLSLFSWIATTIGTMFIALVFCRISQMVKRTGGPYAYAQEGLGNVIGFQTAFCYWVAIWVGNAAIILTGVSHLAIFFPSISHPVLICIISIAFIWLFTIINLSGIKNAGFTTTILTIAKLVPLAMIIFAGWFYFRPELLADSLNVTKPHVSNFSLITQGATLTLWAFIGVESATVPSESVHNPKRNIPLATLLGAGIAAVVYIGSSVVVMGLVPNASLQTSGSPFAEAALVIFGEWGQTLVAIGAIISCLGCLNGWILLQGQIPMAAAGDGLFLKIFGKKNKHDIPAWGIIITSVFITILLLLTMSKDLVKQFQEIILMATLANLIPYLYTPVSEIILFVRRKVSMKKSTIFVAIVTILYSLWAIAGAGMDTLALSAMLIMASIPLYLFTGKGEAE